jgi:hypothetical protein
MFFSLVLSAWGILFRGIGLEIKGLSLDCDVFIIFFSVQSVWSFVLMNPNPSFFVYSNAQVSFFFFCFRFCLATSCEQVQLEVPARSFLVMEKIPSHREECRSRRICVRTICFQAEASPVSSKRLLQLCLDVCSDCGAECVLETTMSSSSLYSQSL